MYSRKELEDLRFAKIVEQRKLWKDICTALGTKIMREYNDLASNKHQKCIQSNFARKEDTSAIPREECSENMDSELACVEDFQMENLNVLDLSLDQNIMDEDSHVVVEQEYSEEDDSDEDYNSILKPAFLVEGEPDFDSGPPEDGLEYLRRV
ncbi:uncharacterized protein LOC110808908, partial [Carica papaya]|uniref:uncharacterized protein LOC110808908 n=1 Tax=Carica papaya TaxID=3649 RepID=UPI000B8D0882